MLRLFLLLLLASSYISASASPSCVVQIGADIPPVISARLLSHLASCSCSVLPPDAQKGSLAALPPNSVALLLGNCSLSATLIYESEVAALAPEGYIIRSGNLTVSGGTVTLYAAVGSPVAPLLSPAGKTPTGSAFGSYALLSQLGFAFLHPFQALTPSWFVAPISPLNITEEPRWPFRGTHYHTEHPLELHEFFNGFDSIDQPWEGMIGEYQGLLEWLVASGQNRLEFSLLYAEEWAAFAYSSLRQSRLANITAIASSFGITVGADAGIAIKQQHAMFMVDDVSNMNTAQEQIRKATDWLVGANFDYLACESGYSEFTHPEDTTMMALMNYLTAYAEDTYSKNVWIKCHCSQGQYCTHYNDPVSGKPLNFNFLPYYADPRLNIFPHTVQFYTFDDPAWTYGNENFSYMFEFIFENVGKRNVVYHGESAYWCNYDVDVPLFLPLYGYGRVYDLRKIALEENSRGVRMQGYMDFNSGFEWSYWLNSLIAARAAWVGGDAYPDEDTAFAANLEYIFTPFGSAAAPIVSFLTSFVATQRALFIYGNVTSISGEDGDAVTTNRRNGQAYLEGWDAWSTLGTLSNGQTQPVRIGLEEIRLPFHGGPSNADILALLTALETFLNTSITSLTAALSTAPSYLSPLSQDMIDTMQMTALRATQVHAVYDYASSWAYGSPAWRSSRLQAARDAMAAAASVVAARESAYRVPVERIGSWRENPTAYNYTYLWTVHSQFYFWRDLGQSLDENLEALSPCYMNIINPIDVGFGEGYLMNITIALAKYFNSTDEQLWSECLRCPAKEPVYPNDTLIL